MKKRKSKYLKIIISVAVILIVTVCFSAFIISLTDSDKISAYFSVFSFPDEFSADEQPLSLYNYEQLSSVEKQAYICVFNNIRSHPEYIKIPKLTREEFNNVYFAVKNDNPDLLCFADSCNMITFMASSFLELHYAYSSDQCEQMRSELLNKVDQILADMTELNDDYSKELFIHDYIVNTCVYEEASDSSNAYGCLIENKAVCSGYSRAAMLLLEKAGIKAVLLGGTGISSSQGQISHMWNIVWLDGKPYHLDVTWDDTGAENEYSASHMYFNLSDDEISSDHTDFSFNEACDNDTYNYFRYNGLYFDSYGKSELLTIQNELLNNINNGTNYLEIRFESETDYEAAAAAIIDSVSPNSDMYKIITFITSNAGDKVDVSHVNFARDDNKNYIRLMFDWK